MHWLILSKKMCRVSPLKHSHTWHVYHCFFLKSHMSRFENELFLDLEENWIILDQLIFKSLIQIIELITSDYKSAFRCALIIIYKQIYIQANLIICKSTLLFLKFQKFHYVLPFRTTSTIVIRSIKCIPCHFAHRVYTYDVSIVAPR